MMASATESTLGEAVIERLCQAAQPALAAPTRTKKSLGGGLCCIHRAAQAPLRAPAPPNAGRCRG
jgi:hypothetical protein